MDTPSIIYGSQVDFKRLFYSEPMAALRLPITVSPGWGVLKQGTVLALNGSAGGRDGQFFPYDPTATITGAENAPGRAYLVADSGGAANDVYVAIADAYKFMVADDIYIADSDGEGTAESLGAITAIDVTTYPHMAKITFTTATSDSFTTAKFGYIAPEGFNTAVGILEKSVDTGTGVNAKGANASLLIGNCVVYNGMLLNMDSNARTDLTATVLGQFLYMK